MKFIYCEFVNDMVCVVFIIDFFVDFKGSDVIVYKGVKFKVNKVDNLFIFYIIIFGFDKVVMFQVLCLLSML